MAACAGGDGGDPAPDAPPQNTTPVCGDGECVAAEVGVCAQDCGSTSSPVCGNQMCEQGETTSNCPNDCQQAGPICGDMACDMAGGENSTNCPGDCGGGGGGTLDCQAQETLFACALCLIDPAGCVPPFTQQECEACLAI